MIRALDRIALHARVDVEAANAEAAARIIKGKPTLVGVGKALEVIPGMTKKTVLHSGPPMAWKRMCGPMRGAVIGGLIYEGLAKDRAEAEALAASGRDQASIPATTMALWGPWPGS